MVKTPLAWLFSRGWSSRSQYCRDWSYYQEYRQKDDHCRIVGWKNSVFLKCLFDGDTVDGWGIQEAPWSAQLLPSTIQYVHERTKNCSIERCDESNQFFDAFHSTFVLAEVGGSIVFQGLANRAARNIPQTIKQLIMKVYKYAGIFFPAICWLKKLSGYDATLIWARIITPSNWVNY